METIEFFNGVLLVATFLCSLVAGFLFAFSIVAMPGIAELEDEEFIRAFQAMDRVIQNNQPIFIAVWVGSVVALIAATALGSGRLEGPSQWLLNVAALAYLVGVQLPTIAINIPLNNRLQRVNVSDIDKLAQKIARDAFEPRWNRWNLIRAAFSSVVSALLIVLVFTL